MRLLITDLDNTLYDWVTYFSKSFRAMVSRLSELIAVPQERLLDEFRVVHQSHGNSEHPFAVFEIASVRERFRGLSSAELKIELDDALHEFNRTRRKYLKLYPGVLETLTSLRKMGVTIVGHTEANAVNAAFRMRFLGIEHFFKHLYALEDAGSPHPVSGRTFASTDMVRTVSRSERKPNPLLLADICAQEFVSPAEAVFVGDSLTRDIKMARSAGVMAVWASYGLRYERTDWDLLVKVTHWSEEDVRREQLLRQQTVGTEPDLTIQSFSDILTLNWSDVVSR